MATNDPNIQKEIIKEAIKEWLNDKVTQFGWFSIRTIAYMLFGALVYGWFATHGWSIPK